MSYRDPFVERHGFDDPLSAFVCRYCGFMMTKIEAELAIIDLKIIAHFPTCSWKNLTLVRPEPLEGIKLRWKE